jgi:hypothetical protein
MVGESYSPGIGLEVERHTVPAAEAHHIDPAEEGLHIDLVEGEHRIGPESVEHRTGPGDLEGFEDHVDPVDPEGPEDLGNRPGEPGRRIGAVVQRDQKTAALERRVRGRTAEDAHREGWRYREGLEMESRVSRIAGVAGIAGGCHNHSSVADPVSITMIDR